MAIVWGDVCGGFWAAYIFGGWGGDFWCGRRFLGRDGFLGRGDYFGGEATVPGAGHFFGGGAAFLGSTSLRRSSKLDISRAFPQTFAGLGRLLLPRRLLLRLGDSFWGGRLFRGARRLFFGWGAAFSGKFLMVRATLPGAGRLFRGWGDSPLRGTWCMRLWRARLEAAGVAVQKLLESKDTHRPRTLR